MLGNFEQQGLLARKTSAKDARQSHLALTARGVKTFAPHEQRSQRQAGAMLGKLAPRSRRGWSRQWTTIETLLDGGAGTARKPPISNIFCASRGMAI